MPRYAVFFWPQTPLVAGVEADDADAAIVEAGPPLRAALLDGGSWEVLELDAPAEQVEP
jgi:hypothetical protein